MVTNCNKVLAIISNSMYNKANSEPESVFGASTAFRMEANTLGVLHNLIGGTVFEETFDLHIADRRADCDRDCNFSLCDRVGKCK